MSGQNQKTASGPQSLYKQLLSLNARQQARGSFRKISKGGAKARQKTFWGGRAYSGQYSILKGYNSHGGAQSLQGGGGGQASVEKPSLMPRPTCTCTLAPSQNGLAHQVEFLGFMGGAMSLLIDYSRFEKLCKGL